MHIETTINMNSHLLQKLNLAAESLELSRNKVITLLLRKYMELNIKPAKMFSRVKYQKIGEESVSKRVHMRIRSDLYENCLDMRKLFKMSVSFILACSIEKFLSYIIQELIKNPKITDNYYSNYLIIPKFYGPIYSFTIFWGFPRQNLIKKILNTQ